jgi:hypothetical protein
LFIVFSLSFAVAAFMDGSIIINHKRETKLSLPLLEARVLFVNYIKLALAADNLAIGTSLFYGSSYFHVFSFEL